MLLIWGQADFLSLVGTVILNLELTLIIIGWYHALIGFLMTLYTLYYEKENKLVKYVSVGLYYVSNITISAYLTGTMLYDYDAGTTMGWISSALYIIGRLPQLYLNFTRKTTQGLSILMYIFTILGNTFYLLSVVVYSIEPDYIDANMPWIVMIVITVVMDVVVIFQEFYYKKKNKDIENNC